MQTFYVFSSKDLTRLRRAGLGTWLVRWSAFTMWMINFAHILGKKGCGKDMWPPSIALWVTSEATINLWVATYSLQTDTFLWKIPPTYSFYPIVALLTQAIVGRCGNTSQCVCLQLEHYFGQSQSVIILIELNRSVIPTFIKNTLYQPFKG